MVGAFNPLAEQNQQTENGPTLAPRADLGAADVGERVAFWACVGLALVFSQCWILPLTGPGPDPIDPAISASIRNYFFPVYAVVLVLALTRLPGLGAALLRSPLLVLLLAVTFASVLWTIDREVTSRRCVAALVTTLAGVVIAERFTWPRFLEVFAAAFEIGRASCRERVWR